jgi:hypothetical protein
MFGKTKISRTHFAVCKLAAAVEAGLSSREGWKTLGNGLTVQTKGVGQMFLMSVFPAGWPKDAFFSCYMDETGYPLSAVTVRIPHLHLDATFGLTTSNGAITLGSEIVGVED